MLDWNTIKNSSRYQGMKPAEQAKVKADYDAQAATTSSNTASTQTPTQPATTAPKAPIMAPKAPSVSWDQIVSSQRYQDMSPTEQAKVKGDYEAQGGKAEEAGVLQNLGDMWVGGMNAFQHSVESDVAGVARFIGNDRYANELQDSSTTAYEARIKDLQYTAGGRLGIEHGAMVGNTVATMLAPEIMIPAQAVATTGRTFNQISKEEREANPIESRLKALGVGAVDYAANRVMPGYGGAAFKPVEQKIVNNVITRTAENLINKAPSAIATITKQAGRTGLRTGENYLIGGVGGAAEGGATAAATGGDVWEGIKQGWDSGSSSGALLGGLSEAPSVVRAGKKAAGEAVEGIKNIGTPKPVIHPDLQGMNAKIEAEHNDVNNPDYTPEQKAQAYDNSPNKRANDTVNAFSEHGFKATSQMAKGDTATADVLGTTPKEANRKIYNAKENAANLKATLDSMNSSIKSASTDNKSLHEELQKQFKGSSELEDINGFFKENNNIIKQHNDNNLQSADQHAIQAQKHINNLSPETRSIIEQHFITPKGFGDKVDPIAFSKRYGDVLKKVTELNEQYKAPGSNGILDMYENAPGFVKAALNAKTSGAFEAAKQAGKVTNFFIGAAKSRKQAAINKAAQERQSQLDRTQENPNQYSSSMKSDVTAFGAKRDQARRTQAVKDWKAKNDHFDDDLISTVDSTNIDTKHINTVESVQKWRDNIVDDSLAKQITPDNFHDSQLKNSIKKLDTQRNKVVDPTLRSKLTLDNINDDIHVSNIKAMDRARNRELAEQKLEQKAAKNKTMREASDAKEHQAIKDFTSGVGKDIPQEQVAQAIKETTRGGKALSADRVINHLQKIGDKVNMPGSKEWFINQVHKMEFVDNVHKKGMISDINTAFSNGTPKPEKLKTLSNQLGKYEEGIHKRNNREGYAADAMNEASKRNTAIEKHNEAILKANQAEDISKAMENAFGTHDIPEYQKSDFIRKHVNKVLKDGSLSEAQKNKAISEAENVVKDVIVTHGKSIESYNESKLKTSQRTEVSEAMKAELESSNMPEYKKSEFINRHMNKVFREGSLEDADKAIAIKEAKQAAKEYATKGTTTTTGGGKSSKPPKTPKPDNEPLSDSEAKELEKHAVVNFSKAIKGKKSVSDIQSQAELARDKAKSFLKNNPSKMQDVITGINTLERLSIRVAENPDKHIQDLIKNEDIKGINLNNDASGIKGLIFHALTGKNYTGNGDFLLGEGETVASKAAEKKAKREGALSSGKPAKSISERFGVGKMPPKKVKVKPKAEPDEGIVREPRRYSQ